MHQIFSIIYALQPYPKNLMQQLYEDTLFHIRKIHNLLSKNLYNFYELALLSMDHPPTCDYLSFLCPICPPPPSHISYWTICAKTNRIIESISLSNHYTSACITLMPLVSTIIMPFSMMLEGFITSSYCPILLQLWRP